MSDQEIAHVMGRIADTLAARIAQAGTKRRPRGRRAAPAFNASSLPSRAEFAAQGVSPLHAAYMEAQHVAAAFAEYASTFPILADYRDEVLAAEDEYMPGGPPMSPLTTSYFTLWTLFDLRFGRDEETLGECLLGVTELLGIEDRVVDVLRRLAASRMGVFVRDGDDGNGLVRLRELVTRDRIACEVPPAAGARRGSSGTHASAHRSTSTGSPRTTSC